MTSSARHATMTATDPNLTKLLREVQTRVQRAEVFGEITCTDARLDLAALNSAEPAWYRLELDGGKLCVSVLTHNRWLSHSIEADLLHYGDKVEHLLHEEYLEHGLELPEPKVEHYRNPEKVFVFRAEVPVPREKFGTPEGIKLAGTVLLAFEACFRRLGDMDKGDGDE